MAKHFVTTAQTTGQIAHVSSPFSNIAQKTIIARHTAEATRGLGIGCWC